MFQINDYVIYKNQVCLIKEIKKNFFKGHDYYVLSLLLDSTLTVNLPTDTTLLKPILTKDEALNLIAKMPSIPPIENHTKMIENDYKLLLHTGNPEDLMKIIKTTYLRNDERIKHGRKAGEIDEAYFEKAETLLYSSLSKSLDKSIEETKQFVIETILESSK